MGDYLPSYETALSWIRGTLPMLKLAWQFLTGPAIEARLLHPVDFIYALEVRNVRGRTAVPRVFLEDISFADDHFTGLVTSPVEVNRQGIVGWPRLFGAARVLFAILKVDWGPEQGPRLQMDAVLKRTLGGKEGKEEESVIRDWYTLVPPTPIGNHKEIRLTFRVVLYHIDTPQVELMDKTLRFSVTPLPAIGEFQVRLIKPRHASIFET